MYRIGFGKEDNTILINGGYQNKFKNKDIIFSRVD